MEGKRGQAWTGYFFTRKPRVGFEGAFDHVIFRGNQLQKIFRDDQDRLYYLERVEHYRKHYWLKIYAYVLMSNHVHFLLETSKTPLSKIHSSRSQVSKELGIQLFAILVQNGLCGFDESGALRVGQADHLVL